MLLHEIEPFADHHIEELTKILDMFNAKKSGDPQSVQQLEDEEIYLIVREARQALVRFRVCMTDEVRSKEMLHKKFIKMGIMLP